jgi:TRAP-type C4-dicarboxylate transport system permease small subunit
MDTIHAVMRVATRILEVFVTLCFFVILAMTIILVVLRYVFNSSIHGGTELVEYLFIYTSAIGAAAALARREHISITFVVDRLPALGRRIVQAAGFLLVALFNTAAIIYCLPWIRATGGFESPVLRLPNRAIQLIVPIGSALAVLFCLCHIVLTLGGRQTSEEGAAE